MESLKTKYDGIEVYNAGLPLFPRNFTRDSIISAIISKDPGVLKNQLIFNAYKQGKKKNPITGEEIGKIHHEYPGVIIDNYSTLFNACDTTALFLLGHDYYQRFTHDKELAQTQSVQIQHAIKYIITHVKNGLFIEDPRFAHAKRFALKVTYWKDSEIKGRKKGVPVYPITYTLAHIQNLSAIRSAAKITDSSTLITIAEKMKEALKKLYDNKNKTWYLAIDKEGPIEGVTSDALHALFYLEKNDITEKQIREIINTSKILETNVGYRTMDPKYKIDDPYHSETVWPFEQALIDEGAKKFDLKNVEETCRRIINFLDTAPEYFKIVSGKFEKVGCDPQLWTLAAKEYFNH